MIIRIFCAFVLALVLFYSQFTSADLVDPTNDDDLDGFTNRHEVWYGSDPSDEGSKPQLIPWIGYQGGADNNGFVPFDFNPEMIGLAWENSEFMGDFVAVAGSVGSYLVVHGNRSTNSDETDSSEVVGRFVGLIDAEDGTEVHTASGEGVTANTPPLIYGSKYHYLYGTSNSLVGLHSQLLSGPLSDLSGAVGYFSTAEMFTQYSPIVYSNRMYGFVSRYSSYGNLTAYNLQTGVQEWSLQLPSSFANQHTLNQNYLVSPSSIGLIVVNRVTGQRIRSIGAGCSLVNGTSPLVFLSTTDVLVKTPQCLSRINIITGQLVWIKYIRSSSSPVASDESIYLHDNTFIYAIDPADGSTQWSSYQGGNAIQHEMIATIQYLIIAKQDGVVIFDKSKRTTVWQTEFTGRLTLGNNYLLTVATDGGVIYGFDLRGDEDGDSLPNWWEKKNNLDPQDATDAASDLDDDYSLSGEEYIRGTDPNNSDTDNDGVLDGEDNNPLLDDVAPEIYPTEIPILAATGLLTDVTLSAVALDSKDGRVPVEANNYGPFPSGNTEVFWSATDGSGNSKIVPQIIRIQPFVTISEGQTVLEGDSVPVKVQLSGSAVDYPVVVRLGVQQDDLLKDIGFSHSEVVFEEQDDREKQVLVHALEDGVFEGAEVFEVEIVGATNAIVTGEQKLELTIVEENLPPVLKANLTQGGRSGVAIVGGSELVTIELSINDPNPQDQHLVEWISADGSVEINSVDGNPLKFVFATENLSLGFHEISALVSELSDEPLSSRLTLSFRVASHLPLLTDDSDLDRDGDSDLAEGFKDSDLDGVPDYLDAISLSNQIQGVHGPMNFFIVQSAPGVSLVLGDYSVDRAAAISQKDDVAAVYESKHETSLDLQLYGDYINLINVKIHSQNDRDWLIVPLTTELSENSELFILDNMGSIRAMDLSQDKFFSTQGSIGSCPSVNEGWREGVLIPGARCLKVEIQDQGANDLLPESRDVTELRLLVSHLQWRTGEDQNGGDDAIPSLEAEANIDRELSDINQNGSSSGGVFGLFLLVLLSLFRIGRVSKLSGTTYFS